MKLHSLHHVTVLILALSLCGVVHAETVRLGTGIAISHATHIVTNAHVVANCKSVRVLLGAQQAAARVVALDADADLAVLKTGLSTPKTLAIRSSPALRLGDSVIAFGFPLSDSLSQGGNLTTGNVSALAGLHDDARYIQMTAPVQPGSSGGPLLDGGGNLVGVITSKLDALAMVKRTGDIPQNVNFAVKTEGLEAFLRKNKVAYDVAVTDRQLSVADVGDIAKDATVKIICEPSAVQTAETETVRAAPSDEPLPVPAPPGEAAALPNPVPVPVPVPQMEPPRGAIPVPADGGQREMTEQIQVIDVRTPYPGTAPAMREIEIRNGAPYSVLQVTIGWLQSLTGPQCPRSPSAYLGTKDLFASLKPGESTTLTGEFTEQARYFCIVSAQFLPPSRRAQPRPAQAPAAPAAPGGAPMPVPQPAPGAAGVPVPIPEGGTTPVPLPGPSPAPVPALEQ
ncbi:MAG TPA: serine protease [Burkholderiales bacterium]|nr:serine protease [Burkholderiales bacterium]